MKNPYFIFHFIVEFISVFFSPHQNNNNATSISAFDSFQDANKRNRTFEWVLEEKEVKEISHQ